MNPKQSKAHMPKLLGILTMQQPKINRLTTRLTHAAPIHNNNPSFAEVVNSKDPTEVSKVILIMLSTKRGESKGSWAISFYSKGR